MLNCREIAEHTGPYVDGDLPWYARAKIWIHIRMCARCRRYVMQTKLVVAAVHDLFEAADMPRPDEQAISQFLLRSNTS